MSPDRQFAKIYGVGFANCEGHFTGPFNHLEFVLERPLDRVVKPPVRCHGDHKDLGVLVLLLNMLSEDHALDVDVLFGAPAENELEVAHEAEVAADLGSDGGADSCAHCP